MPLSSIPAASRRRRMLGWFAGDGGGEPVADTRPAVNLADTRAMVQRRLFNDIGELMFAHALTPSPRTYSVLHSYLSGDDVRTSAAVASELRDGVRLTDAAVMRIATNASAAELQPDALARIADALETRIAECLSAAGESRSSAETFGTALNEEAEKLEHDPHAALQRIVALTHEAVEATQLVEAQLQRTREEANRLRTDLQRARRAAEQDHLTSLPNRRCFESRLRAVTSAADGANAVVALCDIDDFKQINDRFGHPAGDRVLKFVATFLRGQLGRKVVVARYGGEEFACLFEHHTLAEARLMLDRARDRLTERSLVHQESGETIGHISFSAGVTAIGAADGVEALGRADLALYAAKNGGKNRVVCAGPI